MKNMEAQLKQFNAEKERMLMERKEATLVAEREEVAKMEVAKTQAATKIPFYPPCAHRDLKPQPRLPPPPLRSNLGCFAL